MSDEQKRQIDKVKYDGKRVIIHYTVKHDEREPDEYKLSCGDEPQQPFKDAFEALRKHVGAWLEIDDPQWVADIEPRGISFSWSHDIMGAVITAQRQMTNCNSPLTINTPHKPEEAYSDGNEDEPVIDPDCAEALRTVIHEANRYIDGHRAQMSMFGPETQEAA